ncbi:MAG TPA: glycine--tRNA ligase subunit beta [Acidobacteriota bacterium]|jgi:glycyl-tRNA synthetase beta chain|nr:glycine--tRNA ligase subunit beta [Acidobacteriota bacterium]
MSHRLLFELGTEEIPASMIVPALEDLRRGMEGALAEPGLGWEEVHTFTTPRRLAVLFTGLPERCPDRGELAWGPPVSVAFDTAGRPTPAAEGFARKLGVGTDSLEQADNERGRYVVVRQVVPGIPVVDLVKEILPGVIASIRWPKTMYWTPSRFRFIRPIRWIVLLWDDEVIPFEFEGVKADRWSRGHRLIGPSRIEISEAAAYEEILRSGGILVSPGERRRIIEAGLQRISGDLQPVPDSELLETVVHLNEWPAVIKGSFSPEFLRIPAEVLVTVMRHHQKYFSLVDQEGRLAPSFVAVINNRQDADGTIREGHEKVLRARLEDAAFFWDADRKIRLSERVERLRDVLFQEKLGSYFDKTGRLVRLSNRLDPDPQLAEAARLCKADLTTEMVRELPELQGVMGGLYAREEGYPEGVWRAVYEHYRPVSLDDELPESRNGALLSVADRMDTIVGCFGAGIVPSGSSDPFGLRRQAQGAVEILRAWRFEYSLRELVESALSGFPWEEEQGVREAVLAFLEQRVSFLLERLGLARDVVRAVCATGIASASPAELEDRARAVARIRGNEDFEALAVAFKRAMNLLARSGESEVAEPDPGRLQEEGEKRFYEVLQEWVPRVRASVERKDYDRALELIAEIRPAVDRFFDDVLVMVDDASVRRNRLALLRRVVDSILMVVDPSQILVQGGGENG